MLRMDWMNSARRGFAKKDLVFLIVIVAAVVLVVSFKGGSSQPVDAPAMFAQHLELREAIRQGIETETPVLVYATASWCGPCQIFKREALSDPDVEMMATTRTLPVYMDIDKHREEARLLQIEGVPMLLLIDGEEVIATQTGAHSAQDTYDWLSENTGPGRAISGVSSAD